MRITADSNLLLRATVRDDPEQASVAEALLRQATLVAVPAPALCEFVWVLRRTYGRSSSEAAAAIEAILRSRTVSTDYPAVEAGLRLLRAGGDFADGVIAPAGRDPGRNGSGEFRSARGGPSQGGGGRRLPIRPSWWFPVRSSQTRARRAPADRTRRW